MFFCWLAWERGELWDDHEQPKHGVLLWWLGHTVSQLEPARKAAMVRLGSDGTEKKNASFLSAMMQPRRIWKDIFLRKWEALVLAAALIPWKPANRSWPTHGSWWIVTDFSEGPDEWNIPVVSLDGASERKCSLDYKTFEDIWRHLNWWKCGKLVVNHRTTRTMIPWWVFGKVLARLLSPGTQGWRLKTPVGWL